MRLIRVIIKCAIVLLLSGSVPLWGLLPFSFGLRLAALAVLVLLFLIMLLAPVRRRGRPAKLARLEGGCELLLVAAVCVPLELLGYAYLALSRPLPFRFWLGSAAVFYAVLLLLLVAALLRVFFASSQLSGAQRLCLLLLWWPPVVNLFVFVSVYKTAFAEYSLLMKHHLLNESRRDEQVCRTKYPLLLVHGIFFRDWKHFNYWGRIPAALEENGAVIHYGGQQSSAAVETSAEELRDSIERIVRESGCSKVNIIAHSKGGLDSRYAISCLGMDASVASLTTINTPHRGCRFAKRALDNLPEGLVSFISKKYDGIFSKLGDEHPDFYSGVSELTDEKCAELNEQMPDMEGIVYRSIGSRMSAASSAVFPLNLGYSIVAALDGDNDGLVATSSMPHGEFRLLIPTGKRGISHGDVIDLTRKDIRDFDVTEFYVGLVSELKALGL